MKVTHAIFCIYDVVFHRDVRVDMQIPGKMVVHSIDEGLKKDHVSELEWTCAYVSSTLRALHSHWFQGVRILPPLNTPETYNEFITAAKLLISKGPLPPHACRIRTRSQYRRVADFSELFGGRSGGVSDQQLLVPQRHRFLKASYDLSSVELG